MIDLHCHILPGIDDGAKTMDDSLAMARVAVAEGITHILVTPHYKNGRWTNEKEVVLEGVTAVQKELDKREIPLILFPGQEVRIVGELMEDILENKIQFIDEANQYLLIEYALVAGVSFSRRLLLNIAKAIVLP